MNKKKFSITKFLYFTDVIILLLYLQRYREFITGFVINIIFLFFQYDKLYLLNYLLNKNTFIFHELSIKVTLASSFYVSTVFAKEKYSTFSHCRIFLSMYF